MKARLAVEERSTPQNNPQLILARGQITIALLEYNLLKNGYALTWEQGLEETQEDTVQIAPRNN